MKYFNMDEEEIRIRTKLKNISSINAMVLAEDKILINCVAGNELFSYDTKSKYFDLFFANLKAAYEKEKDTKTIFTVTPFLFDLLNSSIASEVPFSFKNHKVLEQTRIYYQKYDLFSLRPFIYEILAILCGVQDIKIRKISDIKGIRDLFSLVIETETHEKVIPIKYCKNNDFSYNFVLGNVYGLKSIDMCLDFLRDEIRVTWSSKGLDICGDILYRVNNDSVENIVNVYYGGNLKYTNTSRIEPSQEEMNETLKLDGNYQGYQIFNLPNGVKVVAKQSEEENNILFVTENEHIAKIRNTYTKYKRIKKIPCPIVSSKRVHEQYKIDDTLRLSQIYFNDEETEESLYRDVFVNQTRFSIYHNGKMQDIEREEDVVIAKSLDRKNLLMIIDRRI